MGGKIGNGGHRLTFCERYSVSLQDIVCQSIGQGSAAGDAQIQRDDTICYGYVAGHE